MVLIPSSCCCGGTSCGVVATQGRKVGAETLLAVVAAATAVQLKGQNLKGMPQPQGSIKSTC